MKSMVAIRDAEDLDVAIANAQKMIDQLEQQGSGAAAILRETLKKYISKPASVPALLASNEIDGFLDDGSSIENYLTMASGVLDTATTWSRVAAKTPPMIVAATALTILNGTVAGVHVAQDNIVKRREQEWARRQRNKLLRQQ
jgi:hypothetical protein